MKITFREEEESEKMQTSDTCGQVASHWERKEEACANANTSTSKEEPFLARGMVKLRIRRPR